MNKICPENNKYSTYNENIPDIKDNIAWDCFAPFLIWKNHKENYFNRKAKTDQDSSQIQSAISTTKSSSSYLRTIAFMIIGLVLFLSPQLSTLGSTSDIFYIAGFVSIPLGILFMLIALVDGLINLFRK